MTNAHWVDEALDIFLDQEQVESDALKVETRSIQRQTFDKDPTKKFRKQPARFSEMEVGFIDKIGTSRF